MTITTTNVPAAELPSKRKLAITTLVLLLVAMVILVTIVLPAEYGSDPLGTGEALGVTAISRPVAADPVEAPAGATMLYSWQASAPVIHDLHGELNADPEKVTTFNQSDRTNDHGAFVAPFTGIHGWYWENTGGAPVTIKLTSSGFYASPAVEFRPDKTRTTHEMSVP